MKRPPRDPRESVFSADVRALILMGVVLECPMFLWVFFQNYAELDLARTKIFCMFVVIELIVALNFRSLRHRVFQAPPHRSLVLSIVGTLALTAALVQSEAVRDVFGIVVPSVADLVTVLAMGLVVFVAIEAVKAALRARTRA